MKSKRSAPVPALRRQAEKQLKAQPIKSAPVRTETDTRRLVNELQVHQIELEMQNTELQRARTEVEATLIRYTELYDFAPVGYFSIDATGVIQEVNLTGAAMLGVVRSQLLKRRLQGVVAPASRPVIEAFLKTVFARRENTPARANY